MTQMQLDRGNLTDRLNCHLNQSTKSIHTHDAPEVSTASSHTSMFGLLVALAMAFVPSTPPMLVHPAVRGVSITANEPRRDDSRLLKPTGDPRLWWLDELLENAEERTVREKAKRANIEKWGAILREADTFDEDTVTRSDSLKINKRGEVILVALSAPVLLALLAHAYL